MHTYYLKTGMSRQALTGKFREHTFLEEKNAIQHKGTEKYFSGSISEEEAWLCSIHPKYRLSPYMQVLFRGIEEDMYLILTPRIYSNAALPLLMVLFCAAACYLLYRLFAVWHFEALRMMEFWVLAPVLMLMIGFVMAQRIRFRKSQELTLDFMREFCAAEVIKKEDIPGVFLLR